jgi:hypothetical protein
MDLLFNQFSSWTLNEEEWPALGSSTTSSTITTSSSETIPPQPTNQRFLHGNSLLKRKSIHIYIFLYSKYSLILFLCTYNRCNEQNLAFILRKRRRENLQLLQFLTVTMPLGRSEYGVTAHGLTSDGARRLFSHRNHRSRTTVESYYFVKYGITLQHPHLPCIITYGGWTSSGGSHECYFPIEVLKCYITKEAEKFLKN